MKKLLRFVLVLAILALVMPVNLRAADNPFVDLSIHHPNYEAILNLESRGVIKGYDNKTFGPDKQINRAELVKIVVNARGLHEPDCYKNYVNSSNEITLKNGVNKPYFLDITDHSLWYDSYVCSGLYHGLIKGYDDNTFRPTQNINFAETSKIIVNGFGYAVPAHGPTEQWFIPFAKVLENNNSIPTSIYSFSKFVTRGDVSEIYYRMLEKSTTTTRLNNRHLVASTDNAYLLVQSNAADRSSFTVEQVMVGAEHYVVFNPNNDWKVSEMNLRTGASTSAPYLVDAYTKDYKFRSNEIIKAYGGPSGDWQKIKYYDGQEGYIHQSGVLYDATADSIIRKMEQRIKEHNDYHSTDFKPTRLPRQSCATKFDWKYEKGGEAILLGYAASQWNPEKKVYAVEPGYFPFYEKMGGVCSSSGGPLSDRNETGSSKGTKGHYQSFEHARIYESTHGTYSVTGEIFNIHENESNDNERGTWSKYGFPTSEVKREGGNLVQKFEGGDISIDAPRKFKTSIADVVVRSQTKTSSDEVTIIPTIKTEIDVVGNAVKGDYVDAYKTDRWYPVDYNGNKGFVLATLLHVGSLGDHEMYDEFVDYESWSSIYKNRNENQQINSVILHFTVGNSHNTAVSERNSSENNIPETGAHYYVGHDGDIAQYLPDFKRVGHVGASTLAQKKAWETTQYRITDGNEFAIGIEIINPGVLSCDENAQNCTSGSNESITDGVVKLSTYFNTAWEIWTNFVDSGWTDVDKSIETWQSVNDAQLITLCELLLYLDERYDFSGDDDLEFIDYDIPDSQYDDRYSMFYYPPNASDREDGVYNDYVRGFRGIYGHYTITGKVEPAPSLDIRQLKRMIDNQSCEIN